MALTRESLWAVLDAHVLRLSLIHTQPTSMDCTYQTDRLVRAADSSMNFFKP